MTKFINYLNEDKRDVVFQDFLYTIGNHCKPFLSDLKSNKVGLLFSGRATAYDVWFEKNVRKNRQPKDSPLEIHKMLDDVFKQKTGKRLRSESLFCYSIMRLTKIYGTPYIIFPFGKYQMWYNDEIFDLFATVRNHTGWDLKEVVDDIVDGYKQGFPKDNVEIMLYCDRYCALNASWVKEHKESELLEFLQINKIRWR
jgi:hypothetical protein